MSFVFLFLFSLSFSLSSWLLGAPMRKQMKNNRGEEKMEERRSILVQQRR